MTNRMGQAYFITGTNTDIGKTFITAGLAKLSTSLGYKTAVMKPIQTGTKEYESDLSIIRSIAPDIAALNESIASPYQYEMAASPHLAAKGAGEKINPINIIKAYKQIKAGCYDTILVEGAGGIYVPIHEQYTMLDLMKDLALPVIIVGTVELGAINHALLSINALRQANIDIAGIILNKIPRNPSTIELDNIETIEKLGNVPLLGTISNVETSTNLSESLLELMNTDCFMKLFL